MREERAIVIAGLWKAFKEEEQEWKQKSRVKWLLDGDKNTKFFHNVSNARQRMNYIGEVVIDGKVCKDPAQMREGVAYFFSERFKKSLLPNSKISGMSRSCLSKRRLP